MQGRKLLVTVLAGMAFISATGANRKVASRSPVFNFTGVKAVSEKQLKAVLATAASSKIPFGEKYYFSREQFQADLKRITAFYQDRGFPDARVTSFDAKLSKNQDSVAITVAVAEGQPIRVERVVLEGIDGLPEEHRQALERQLPLKAGAPLDRALVQASREGVLDELKDHGYPLRDRPSLRDGRLERS